MLQKSGRLVLWEAMFILELHSAETQAGALFTLFPLVVMLQKMMLHTILFVGDDRT